MCPLFLVGVAMKSKSRILSGYSTPWTQECDVDVAEKVTQPPASSTRHPCVRGNESELKLTNYRGFCLFNSADDAFTPPLNRGSDGEQVPVPALKDVGQALV